MAVQYCVLKLFTEVKIIRFGTSKLKSEYLVREDGTTIGKVSQFIATLIPWTAFSSVGPDESLNFGSVSVSWMNRRLHTKLIN